MIRSRMFAGISRKSQELTAIFLGIRLYCRRARTHSLQPSHACRTLLRSALLVKNLSSEIHSASIETGSISRSWEESSLWSAEGEPLNRASAPIRCCSFVMEYDVHTLLDLLTFLATGWVLFMMHTKLKKSYTPDLDTVRIEFVVRPRNCLWGIALLHHAPLNLEGGLTPQQRREQAPPVLRLPPPLTTALRRRRSSCRAPSWP